LEVVFPLHAFWILWLICLFFFSFLEEAKHKGGVPKYQLDWKQFFFSVWYLEKVEQRRIESLQLGLTYEPINSIKIY
jgi:hypothetical protein